MTTYDPIIFSRILTGTTLFFHIIYATIGVGVPLIIALAEWIGIKHNDADYLLMARRWARGFTVMVAVGVVTGTCIALQLSFLWPNFMRVAGQAIALPLFMETFAFFVEAIFLGIYLYTWDRFSNQMYHFLLLIPVVIGSSASAFFITTVNAFMNAPRGFEFIGGKMTNIDPIMAMFNPAMPTKVCHVLVTAYVTCAFILAALAALALLRGKKHVYYKKALRLTMVTACVFALSSAIIGDLSGKYLHQYQPEKLAAAEWHFKTKPQADLIVGGILTADNEVKYGLHIPFALSILAGGTPDTVVAGLDKIPVDQRPPLIATHYFFDAMVFIGVYLVVISLWYVIFYVRKKRNKQSNISCNKWLLRAIVLGGPFSLLAIELGWMFSEVGRQPWILWKLITVSEGATPAQHVDTMLWLFTGLYVILTITSGRVLIRMFKHNTAEVEIAATRKGV